MADYIEPPTPSRAYQRLEQRAEYAAHKACEMMDRGSREYEQIKHFVEEYMTFRFAADKMSGQTDSTLLDLDP